MLLVTQNNHILLFIFYFLFFFFCFIFYFLFFNVTKNLINFTYKYFINNSEKKDKIKLNSM